MSEQVDISNLSEIHQQVNSEMTAPQKSPQQRFEEQQTENHAVQASLDMAKRLKEMQDGIKLEISQT